MEQQPSESSANHQDILDLPETLVGEIINGRLIAHPRLNAKARIAKDRLVCVLENHFGHAASAAGSSIEGER